MPVYAKGKERIQADLLMFLAAVVWGGGFVAQRVATQYLGYFAYNGIRFLLAGLVLLPIGIRNLKKFDRSLLWILPAGVLLFGGSALQQAGLKTTSAGSAGFITGVYVVLVPLFLALFWREKISIVNWLAAFAAVGGTYLLSTGGKTMSLSSGDILELLGAVVWAFHVIVVGLAVRQLDIYVFSVGQFLFCGLVSLAFNQLSGPLVWSEIHSGLWAILYGGIFSVALGFTLQGIGLSKAPAADAVLILSLESVFAAIFGALILFERMNWIQIIGCAIIMAAILGVQIYSLHRANQLEVNLEANN